MSSTSSYAGLVTQLALLGEADVYLTCDPKSSHFHQTYARVKNFAVAPQNIPFSGNNTPSGQTWRDSRVKIDDLKNGGDSGDLVGNVFLDFTLSALPRPFQDGNNLFFYKWTSAVGYAIIADTAVKAGHDIIEGGFGGEYFIMHDEISRGKGKQAGALVGDYGQIKSAWNTTNNFEGVKCKDNALMGALNFSTRTQRILAPLPYFFAKDPSSYLNVSGIVYQNISLEFDLRGSDKLRQSSRVDYTTGEVEENNATFPGGYPGLQTGEGEISGLGIVATYVYLDAQERIERAKATEVRKFVYAKRQVFDTHDNRQGTEITCTVGAGGPVKRFMWAWLQDDAVSSELNYFQFGTFRDARVVLYNDGTRTKMSCENVPYISKTEIEINGSTRVNQASEYFLYAQSYANAKRVPTEARLVHSYATSLYPENETEHSGSLNLSLIDSTLVKFTLKTVGPNNRTYPLPGNPELFLAANDGVADKVTRTIGGSDATVLKTNSKDGKILFFTETINFYKQVEGMIGVMFAQ